MGILFLAVVLSLLVGFIASERGRSFAGWTLISLLISPLLAGLALLVVGRPD